MKQAVWEHALSQVDLVLCRYGGCAITLPRGAKPLVVRKQDDELVLYALVDTEQELIGYVLRAVETGELLPEKGYEGIYINTVDVLNGALVLHFLWEVYDPKSGKAEKLV